MYYNSVNNIYNLVLDGKLLEWTVRTRAGPAGLLAAWWLGLGAQCLPKKGCLASSLSQEKLFNVC